jgi:hypothetical protein
LVKGVIMCLVVDVRSAAKNSRSRYTLPAAKNTNDNDSAGSRFDGRRWLLLVDIAKAALATGHAVVATGRDAAKVAGAVGDHDNLLATKLDVTRQQDAQVAVETAVAKFGRIDILVNNAGNFFAGFFEELSPE